MKKITLLLFILLPLFVYAQKEQPNKFGVGLGYNFNSVMGDTIRPFEISLRYKINNRHTLQLNIPFLKHKSEFRSEVASFHSIQTVLETKKKAFGIGLDYDYSLFSCSFIDFLAGARIEYLSFDYETNISDSHVVRERESGHLFDAIDYTFYSKNGSYWRLGPYLGVRTEICKFYVDAKLSLSGMFIKKSLYKHRKTAIDKQSKVETTEVDFTTPLPNTFKIKSAIALSVSHYF